MDTQQIVAALIAERDRLNIAINALQGNDKRRGRAPKNPMAAMVTTAPAPTANGRKREMTAAARKAQSRRMKAYWQKRRKEARGK